MLKKALCPQLVCLLFFAASSEAVASGKSEDFYTMLKIMKERFVDIQDYQCILESSAANAKGYHRSVAQYYFKKPKAIRMEFIVGKYPGTVLIYNPNLAPDKVKVKLGSAVKAAFHRFLFGDLLDLDDKRVKSLRGYGINETDWGWFIDEHMKTVQTQGELYENRFGGIQPLNGRSTLYYELVSKDPQKTKSIKKEELWIDKESLMPLRYRLYGKSGKLVQSCNFKEIKLNGNLKEDLFDYSKKAPERDLNEKNPIQQFLENLEIIPH